MQKYRHLFFDLDNTLYDFSANSKLALKEAFRQLGLLDLLPSFDRYFEVYSQINDALWAAYREQKLSKEILRGKRHYDSLLQFDIQPTMKATEIDDCYLQVMTLQTELFPDTIHVLGELRQRGYFIHIITNGFKEVQHHKLINTGLKPFVNDIYISEVIKAPKPARAIFDYALKSSNARKKESLMIGDSWESDIVGAKNAGIDQVYFQIDGAPEIPDGSEAPTYTIKDLKELLTIL